MDPLQSEQPTQHSQTVIECQPSILINNNDIVTKTENNNDDQAEMRRRAPTRHSIKSLSGRKTLSKQASVNESKRKSNKSPTTPINTSNETKFHYVPSVSQIAPLPQNKSHGILPVLSLDGRDAPNPMQSDTSENDLTLNTTTTNNQSSSRQPHRICLDPTTRRQYSYSQSSVLSEGTKPVPGIYSTSLVNVDHKKVITMYHPLKRQINPNELTVDFQTSYNYRSRANSNIIERRFSNVEQPTQISKRVCNRQQRSQNSNPAAVSAYRRTLPSENSNDTTAQNPNDTNEAIDIVEPIIVNNTPGYAADQAQYRSCRRSSVQFLDKKLIQSFASPVTSTVTADDDSNAAASVSEAECEFELAYFLSIQFFFS
ncbi:unnamed protein product [Rotaria sp. Silwood1]|nr:unnamed protein product [Rotaria sp. Silwood1]